MKGIAMSDLYDYLKNNHEIEFSYGGDIFTIQPSGLDTRSLWSIWKATLNGEADCICEYVQKSDAEDLDISIQNFMSMPCFEGKSFLDIEENVTVEVVF